MQHLVMHRLVPVGSIALWLVLSAGSATGDDLATFRDESRKVVGEIASRLGSALQKEMAANGPVAAVRVCRDLAPAIASEFSRRTGERVTRVSLRMRNPLLATPDAWEQKVLADFEARMGKESPAGIEYSETVTEPQGTFMRYMKAIPVQDVCLQCHGTPETMSPEVKAQLAAEYPMDRATGYSVNQLRGAFSIKRLAAASGTSGAPVR